MVEYRGKKPGGMSEAYTKKRSYISSWSARRIEPQSIISYHLTIMIPAKGGSESRIMHIHWYLVWRESLDDVIHRDIGRPTYQNSLVLL